MVFRPQLKLENMRTIKLFIALLLCLNLGGCAQMRVLVSTADSDLVRAKWDIIQHRHTAFAFSLAKDEVFSNEIFDRVKMMEYIIKDIDDGIHRFEIDSFDRLLFIDNIDNSISERCDTIKKWYSKAVKLTDEQKYEEAHLTFLITMEKANDLEYLIKDELVSLSGSDLTIKVLETFNSIVSKVAKGKRANLLGDPMVSFITKNENIHKLWNSNYNTTKSSTYFGNSDIAVVLQEDPESYNNNYSIKGVRVDADQLIQSSFDALAQSINIMASSMGVPLPATDQNDFLNPDIASEIQNLPGEKNKLRAKEKKYETYKKLLLLAILNKDLDNMTEDQLKEAIVQIKSKWDKFKVKMKTE